MYNPDIEDAPPSAVPALLSALKACDGVLFGNPEYSHAYSGALKNALDWANEPDALMGKRVTSLSAAPSQGGGVRGQLALREVLFAMGAHVFVHYELLVRGAKGKFDRDGRLTDADTREQLTKFMAEFAEFVGS
jgi:chromate reductase